MEIIVNGQAQQISDGALLPELFELLKLQGRLAVERNGEIVPRSQHASTRLAAGDQLEIIRAIGGG